MSKMRNGFVTNSSSSSFIISRDQIKRKKLIKILFEIANKEYSRYDYYDDEDDGKKEHFTLEYDLRKEDGNDCVAGRYIIHKATKNHPLDWAGYEWNKYSESEKYDDHWIVENEDCGRYNWYVVEEVLAKHGIEWKRGYCD